MKETIPFLLLIVLWTGLSAQTLDTVQINYKTKKFNAKEHILMTFETIDTTYPSGKSNTIGRYYYFDKAQRTISSVREYDNIKKPHLGMQVIYTFGEDRLAKVTVVPPKSQCEDCASEYFFVGDSLSSKKEIIYTNSNPSLFMAQASYFQSKLPRYLPWGYFEDEIIVDGKMKKLRRWY